MAYRIGSFNVSNLSWLSSRSRDLDLLAKIINIFDIVALQEVLTEGKAITNSLLSRLGPEQWDVRWLNPMEGIREGNNGKIDRRGEGYAFMWRKDKFCLPKKENGETIEPRIIHEYRVNEEHKGKKLIRDPAYGRFQLIQLQNIEIRLINTHIVNKVSENTLKREEEFAILSRQIFAAKSDDRMDTQSIVPYTFILGDYNLNLKESVSVSPYVANKVDIGAYTKGGCWYLFTKQEELSTINKDADSYASNFDHFSFDGRTLESVVRDIPHRLDVVGMAGSIKEYKERVSDHLPIILEIDF